MHETGSLGDGAELVPAAGGGFIGGAVFGPDDDLAGVFGDNPADEGDGGVAGVEPLEGAGGAGEGEFEVFAAAEGEIEGALLIEELDGGGVEREAGGGEFDADVAGAGDVAEVLHKPV